MFAGAYYNFQRLALWSEVLGYIIAFVVFLGIIKIIYILRFNRRMSLLASTLRNAGREMSTFSVLFFITISAYSQFAYVVFGSRLNSYSNFMTTLESLLSLLLGSFDYEELAGLIPTWDLLLLQLYPPDGVHANQHVRVHHYRYLLRSQGGRESTVQRVRAARLHAGAL